MAVKILIKRKVPESKAKDLMWNRSYMVSGQAVLNPGWIIFRILLYSERGKLTTKKAVRIRFLIIMQFI